MYICAIKVYSDDKEHADLIAILYLQDDLRSDLTGSECMLHTQCFSSSPDTDSYLGILMLLFFCCTAGT